MEAARELGDPPWLLKDHVKSAKEEWLTACFVPEGCGRREFQEIAAALLNHRAERFERGFVIRKFLDLRTSGVRTLERRIPEEHRLFFFEGRLVAHAPYHEIGHPLRDVSEYEQLGSRIRSPFFTADIAFPATGGWTVVEINDGGVSALPEDLDPRALYEAILSNNRTPCSSGSSPPQFPAQVGPDTPRSAPAAPQKCSAFPRFV